MSDEIVELDVYVERAGVDAHVGAIELPLRDQEQWREIEGNLVRGQVVEVTRETVGRALLGVTDDDEQALEALPGKLEEAAEEHARRWLVEKGAIGRGRMFPSSWRREVIWYVLGDYANDAMTAGEAVETIESILLWPKGADL